MKILCVGDLVADLVVPINELPLCAGNHQLSNECMFVAGGTSNTLIVAARLGLTTHAVGAVGKDWLGSLLLEQLIAEGVIVDYVYTVDNATTTISIELLDQEAQHVFVGALGQGKPVAPDIDLDVMLEGNKGVFCTSYALGTHSLFSSATSLNLLEHAYNKSIPTFFDLGPAAFTIERSVINTAVGFSTVVLTTQEEITAWMKCDSIVQSTENFFDLGVDTVVIKLGENGCLILNSNSEEIHVEGFNVTVRDTAGAGDAFAAAYIYSYLKGYDHYKSGVIANATGAITVTRIGTGPNVPKVGEINKLISGRGYSLT